MRNIGDLFMLEGTGYFYPGIEMIVTEVDDNGQVKKAKAVHPDPQLGKHGFIEQDGDYFATVWEWSRN